MSFIARLTPYHSNPCTDGCSPKCRVEGSVWRCAKIFASGVTNGTSECRAFVASDINVLLEWSTSFSLSPLEVTAVEIDAFIHALPSSSSKKRQSSADNGLDVYNYQLTRTASGSTNDTLELTLTVGTNDGQSANSKSSRARARRAAASLQSALQIYAGQVNGSEWTAGRMSLWCFVLACSFLILYYFA